MTRSSRFIMQILLAAMVLLAFALAPRPAAAQESYGPPRFDPAALDAMLAPVALYPDPLLTQVLMAATYPDEVEEAGRWLREHPGLNGDDAVRSADGWDWDPSVRSLVAFPTVLQTLADYPSWTRDLGEAFLVQREDVMDAIQHLRRRALAAGTLQSTEYTRVDDTGDAIVIDTVNPQAVYVPYYDPVVAYGNWWWPARPPMRWAPWPGYRAPLARDPYFYWGPAVRLGSGFFFGNFVWPRREVRVVNVRPYYYPRSVVVERQVVPGRTIVERRPSAPDVWRHDTYRRGAAPQREIGRPAVVVPRESRPFDAPRAAPPVRAFGDPDDGRRTSPRGEYRNYERRESVAAPIRTPAPAPMQSVAPRPTQESRGVQRQDGRRDRQADEARARAPASPAVQAPSAQQRSAPPSAQRQREPGAGRGGGRRQSEGNPSD